MFRAAKRNPPVFLCLLFALIAYLPISGLAAWNATVAEHWIYVPSAFLFLAAALQLAELAPRLQELPSTTALAAASLFVLWVLFLSGRSFVRTFDWKDQRTFLERTIAAGGDSARMLINLAGLELTENKLPEAAAHLHAALQKKPDDMPTVDGLCAALVSKGDAKAAEEQINKLAKIDPNNQDLPQFREKLSQLKSSKSQ